jgi:double zinc ribbon protein/adenylate/guanylate cyclase family protein
MKCPRCQAGNRDGARFCRKCGAAFGAVCSRCGAKAEAGSKFCDTCGASLESTPAPPTARRFASPGSYTPRHLAEKILTSKAALEGERKQVTVLFADLKGSMELLADRDPEDARKLLDPVLEQMMEAVHRYEGTVNQVMGDGIMALFGAPLAHEDHAVRACYAALRMPADLSEGYRLAEDTGADARPEPLLGDDVDRTSQQGLQVHEQAAHVEHVAPRLQLDEKVDVTRGVRLTPRR